MPRGRRGLLPTIVPVAAAGALIVLALPHLLSAYHLEVGARSLDRPAEAEHHLQQAIHWVPGNAQAYRLLGQVYRAQGNLPAAVEALLRFSQANPKNPLGHIELAEVYEEIEAAGLPEAEGLNSGVQAAEEWRRAGLNAGNLIEWGEQARQAGRYEEAERWYRRATKLDPESGDPLCALGLLYENQNRWREAKDAYEMATALDQFRRVGRSIPLYRTGIVYSRLEPEEPEKALAAYDSALAANDFGSKAEAADCHVRRAKILRQQQAHPEQYIPDLRQAIALNPDDVEAQILLALAHYERDQDAVLAEAELLKALEIAPESKWPPYYLGQLLRQEGRVREAAAMYRRALEIDPHFAAAGQALQALDTER